MSSPLMSLPRDDTLPGTLAEFVLEFADEERCAALLRRWKYGERGFRCPRCGVEQAWYLPSRRLDECRDADIQPDARLRRRPHGAQWIWLPTDRADRNAECRVG